MNATIRPQYSKISNRSCEGEFTVKEAGADHPHPLRYTVVPKSSWMCANQKLPLIGVAENWWP